MQVVITDFRYTDPDANQHPYRDTVADAGAELVYGEFETEEDVIAGCRDATVAITFKAPISRRVIEELTDCRLVLRNGAGYDNVDISAATEYNVPVATISGYVNEEIAEGAITLLLAASRDLVWVDRDVRESPGFGTRKRTQSMYDKTLGLVGLGNIGQTVVPKAKGLGMEVIATDPYVPDQAFDHLDIERVEFDELLQRSDAISLHCQLTHQTYHLFGQDEFARMKESAILVNTARGPLVDEAALVAAVESDEIWGAGIDVYEVEPPDDAPALECDHIICYPHFIGTGSEQSRERGIRIGCDYIERALAGRELRDLVNPGARKHRPGLINPELENW